MNPNIYLNNAIKEIRDRRFIVGSVDANGNFSISSRPATHPNLATAAAEADRLSVANPGKIFVTMQICSGSAASTVTRI